MTLVPVKYCTHTVGREPRFSAAIGDLVSVRGADGKSLVVATLESIDGDRVTLRRHGEDVVEDLAASYLVGVYLDSP